MIEIEELKPEKKVVIYYVNCNGTMDTDVDVNKKLNEFKSIVSLKDDLPEVVELYVPTKGKEGVETLYL